MWAVLFCLNGGMGGEDDPSTVRIHRWPRRCGGSVAALACYVQANFGGSMSYVYTPRHTEEEYQRYTPNENRRVETVGKIGRVFLLIFAVGVGYLIYADGDVPSWLGWGIAGSFFSFVIAGFTAQGMLMNLDGLVDNALLKERDALHTQVTKMENDIKSVADRARDIKATGHVVMAGDGTTVIIGSDVFKFLQCRQEQ